MLGPKPDLHEAVMNELDYLRAYARENGEAAAWRNAADEIVKLRRYADETRARLAEVEAQAAAMRQALAEAIRGLELVHPMNPVEPCVVYGAWQQCKAALSSNAGRETAERLRLLEELADAATAFIGRCRIVECEARDDEDDCGDWDVCPVERLEDAVKALEGGDADAGTKA